MVDIAAAGPASVCSIPEEAKGEAAADNTLDLVAVSDQVLDVFELQSSPVLDFDFDNYLDCWKDGAIQVAVFDYPDKFVDVVLFAAENFCRCKKSIKFT